MRTLDEVIKANECCDHGELDSRCEDCPYNGIGACCAERESDALHYLRMYRSDQIEWEAAREDWNEKWETFIVARERHLDAVKELKRNDPLTWDELRQIEGKPVWVEVDGYNGYWTIVHWNSNIVFEEYYDWNASPEDLMKAPLVSLDDTNFGKTWQAYRKERNEDR